MTTEPQETVGNQVENMAPPNNQRFIPLRRSAENSLERPRTRGLDEHLAFTAPCGFVAYVADSVIQRALALAERALPSEFIGLCAGQIYHDDKGLYLVLTGIVPDTRAMTAPGHVETTPDSEFATRQSLATHYPDCIPLGWCHSHVGIGAFFSMADRQNQATWSKPYHVGVVVDAVLREVAVFKGPEALQLEHQKGPCGAGGEAAAVLPGSPGCQNNPTSSRLRRAMCRLTRLPEMLFASLASPQLIPVVVAVQALQVALLLFLLFK